MKVNASMILNNVISSQGLQCEVHTIKHAVALCDFMQ